MGHYYAEMFPNGRDTSFHLRYGAYQRKRIEEVLELVSENPLKIEDIKIGDKLKLYSPLNNRSKFCFDNDGDYPIIKSVFDSRAKCFDMSMWSLSSGNSFTVYDIQTQRYFDSHLSKDIETHLVRIDKPNPNICDWCPIFVPIKYFQKPQ